MPPKAARLPTDLLCILAVAVFHLLGLNLIADALRSAMPLPFVALFRGACWYGVFGLTLTGGAMAFRRSWRSRA